MVNNYFHISRGIPDFKNQTGNATITINFKTYPNDTSSTTVTRTVTVLALQNLIHVVEVDKQM